MEKACPVSDACRKWGVPLTFNCFADPITSNMIG